MNKYSLEELHTIFNAKQYLPSDRFVYYFTLRYGYTEKDAKEAYKLFSAFPTMVYQNNKYDLKEIDKIIPLAIQIVEDLFKAWELNTKFEKIKYNDEGDYRKFIYTQNGESKELVINIHDTNDIITYAKVLKQDIQPTALLKFIAEIEDKNNQKLKVFEGDFFDTYDGYYGAKSRVFIADSRGHFKHLLYTKGKGYLYKGEPNYDEEKTYSKYAVSMENWKKIGNIYTDMVKLTDDGIGE